MCGSGGASPGSTRPQGKDLDAAFQQLRQYALALENPPLLIVSDTRRFRIHTNWTNSVSTVHEFTLYELDDPATRNLLKWAFSDPERLRPEQTRQALTEQAAATFAELAQGLREGGHDPQTVAHFVNRLVFCMFAEDVGLLPDQMFRRMLDQARLRPEEFAGYASELFGAMHRQGGRVGFEEVAWFNGGLFDDDTALPLDRPQVNAVREAAGLDWSEIDPSILGTLFERGLDPDKRSQLGAHYTDRDKIMQIVEPVIVRPWLAEWAATKEKLSDLLDRAGKAKTTQAASRRRQRGLEATARVPGAAGGVPGAGPGLRVRQLPVPGAARAEGPGTPGAGGGADAGAATAVSGGRSGQREGDRAQPVRGRTGAGVGLDRRDPVDAASWLPRGPRPDSEAAGHDRVPGRGADGGRAGTGVAGGGCGDWESAVSGQLPYARGTG